MITRLIVAICVWLLGFHCKWTIDVIKDMWRKEQTDDSN